jgi:hypothetical protein
MGHLNPYKAYHRRIPDPEIVTLHRRSDSKRAYRPQAFFLKLSLTAMIKSIKNKSRSYQKLMIMDTLLTLDFLIAIPLLVSGRARVRLQAMRTGCRVVVIAKLA